MAPCMYFDSQDDDIIIIIIIIIIKLRQRRMFISLTSCILHTHTDLATI
jgi:hypothetical protein